MPSKRFAIINSSIAFLSIVILISLPAHSTGGSPIQNNLPKDVAAKYNHYRDIYVQRHMYNGGTVEALLDEGTKTRMVYPLDLAESQGWTGLTMAAFAFQGDWELVEKNLSYWSLLSIEPGLYKRYQDMPLDNGDNTSIDQYGKMLLGMAAITIAGPDELKKKIAPIITGIAKYGKAHNWKMGGGPYVDIRDIKFLLLLFSDKLGLGLGVLDAGETPPRALKQFMSQFKQAFFIRNASENYFTLNLYFEWMFIAKMLDPDLPGLDKAIEDWYKIVRLDGNTMFDWFHARVSGQDTSFVLDALRAFPPEPPNQWANNGYKVSYRWENSPKTIAGTIPTGLNVEYTGMDFLALASFYSYFLTNNF